MAEKKRVIKGKRKRTRAKKPKEKARQKQKQRQVVNVQVSSGGSGGGGTSFIPMPQAPAFDYSLLANLIRPANTVDMPIRAMASIPNPVATREAESQTLAEALTSEISTQTGPLRPAPPIPKADAPKVKARTKVPIYQKMTEREAGYETFPSSSESETGFIVRKKEGQAASMFRKYGGAFEEE